VQWVVHLHPRVDKKFTRNLQRKFVSAPPAHQVHPLAEQESILMIFLLGGRDLGMEVVHLVASDRLLRVTTKKVNFLENKVHPRQNSGYAYIWRAPMLSTLDRSL